MKKIKRSLGTHDGTFHADEVTACALLILFDLVDEKAIIRTRDLKRLATCEFVCDVGGIYDANRKLFDHHQVDYTGPFSSAGMILAYLKSLSIISEKEYQFLNQSLIYGVDACDNGVDPCPLEYCSFSHVIDNFTPIRYDCSEKEQTEAFFEALHFVSGHLKRLHQRFHYIQSCKSLVADCMARSKECLIFDQNIPWLESFFALGGETHPALFVIMPSENHWKLRGIPPTILEKMKVRKPLPKEWAGLLEEDLRRVSKIPGALFCHKGLFISVWETKEDALSALEITLRS